MQFDHITALVPMRHHSQRVPGKNYRQIAGKPLFHHIISTLLECEEISQIVVDTDSEPILEGLAKHFPEVKAFRRLEALRADSIPMNDILLYDVEQAPADLYLQTHSTNPLLTSRTLSEAIAAFRSNADQYDSLFSATRLQTRLWDQNTKPINHDPEVLLQTQDLPPVYEENSCIYIFTAENLRQRKNRLGEKPLLFAMDPIEALDIDEETDFQIAEAMLRLRQEGKLV